MAADNEQVSWRRGVPAWLAAAAGDPRRLGLAALMLVAAAHIWVVSGRHYFFSDDFLNFIVLREMGPRPGYFLRDFTGEFVPLVRVANLIYFRLFGLHFWPFRLLLQQSSTIAFR